jgi:hypothetical protein
MLDSLISSYARLRGQKQKVSETVIYNLQIKCKTVGKIDREAL